MKSNELKASDLRLKLKPSNDPDNCPACKWHKRNRKNGIKMLGPLAYDVQDKCDNHFKK